MTADEQLEAIRERLDTLAKLQIDTEQQSAKREERLDRRIDRLAQVIDMEHESIKALERIARYHEQRLDDIDKAS